MNNRYRNRNGIGLLEVIICTGLLAVMMVPIAGVIRSSGQAIAHAEGSGTTESKMRESLRWVADAVRDGSLTSVQSRRLKLQLNTGDVVAIEVQRGSLVIDDGRQQTELLSGVRDIRFNLISQTTGARKPIGLTMAVRGTDPTTRNVVTINSTVALPPQA
ncbi:MAG: hypothetical protein AB8B91_10700 [Rubripirellula sp.]